LQPFYIIFLIVLWIKGSHVQKQLTLESDIVCLTNVDNT